MLTESGSEVVVSPPKNFSRGRFDPWLSHARGIFDLELDLCASGRYIARTRFSLLDDSIFYYPMRFFGVYEDGADWIDSWLGYESWNGYKGFIGEWYNFAARHYTFDKVPAANWTAWLDSH